MKILSCGAGQQSTALALMSCENAMSEKIIYPLVPVYDAVLFCDLGGEREWVYKQVAFISECCQKAGIPFYILKNKNLKKDYMTNYGKARVCTIPFWSIDESGKKGKMTRHCTIDYKILQMQNFVRWELLGIKKARGQSWRIYRLMKCILVLLSKSNSGSLTVNTSCLSINFPW